MALYAEVTISVKAWSDTAKQNCRFGLVLEDQVLDNTLAVSSGGRVALAAGAADVEVGLQSVTSGQLITLSSAAEFQVKFNGAGNPALTLKPQAAVDLTVTPAFLAMLATGVTSVHLTNPDDENDIEVDVGIAGI